MKGLFKLTTAALALVTLASCSTDDLFNGEKAQQQAKGDILVEVEPLEDAVTAVTRAAYTPDGKTGTLYFNTGDVIKVTDGTLVKYDLYEYNSGAFVFDKLGTGRDAAWIATPEFASFPATKMEWDNATKQAIGSYYVSPAPVWGEDWETEGAFNAEIPLWGTAQADATYGVKVNMKYLTGVLKINMENVPNNVTDLKVVGWKNLAGTDPAPISGDFKAILANDDELNEDAVLVPDEAGWQGNQIVINCDGTTGGKATKSKSVFFIPLIAQKYGVLEIAYSDDNQTSWKKIKNVENLTVERKKYYNLTKTDFDFAGVNPSDITALLEEKKAESEISVKMSKVTEVLASDYTIVIPETSADITLDFDQLYDADLSATALNFEAAGDYAGTLTLQAHGTTPSDIPAMFFNLPKATVVINGDFNKVNLGADVDGTYNKANSLIANALTIAAKGQVQDIYANAELGYGNTETSFKMVKGSVAQKFELERNYKAKKIELCGTIIPNDLDLTAWQDYDNEKINVSTVTVGDGAGLGTLTTYSDVVVTGGSVTKIENDGNVTVSGGNVATVTFKTDPAAAADAFDKNVTISGEASVGTITPGANHGFNLTVNGKGAVTTTATVKSLTIDGTTATVKDVTVVGGDVTINDTEEAEAVSGTLTMDGGKTLNLFGGYVNALEVSPKFDATSKPLYLNIKHGSSAAFTAINTINGTLTGAWKIDTTTKSIWNGHKIGEYSSSDPAAYQLSQAALATKYGSNAKIYTASQFATSNAAAALYSNINLNSLSWTCPTLAGDFDGKDMDPSKSGNQYPTIENLVLAGNNSVGLFKTNTAVGNINNITVKNVTSNITGSNPAGVGTLIGNVAKAITVNNVTIATAEVGSLSCNDVGGLFGQSSANITLTNVSVSGLTLNGQYRIGGVVGTITGGTIATATTASTLTVTAINVPDAFNAEPDIKVVAEDNTNYGTVGMIAGQAGAVVNDAVKLTVNNLIKGNRGRLGFKMRWFNAGPNVRYYFGRRGDDHTSKNVWIGRITTDDSALKKVTTADEQTAFEDDWNNPTNCYTVKHDMYDALDLAY